jgi:hypothetical protein
VPVFVFFFVFGVDEEVTSLIFINRTVPLVVLNRAF